MTCDALATAYSNALSAMLDASGITFFIQGDPLQTNEIAAVDGLMVIFACRAEQSIHCLYGWPPALSLRTNPQALADVEPVFHDTPVFSLSLMLHVTQSHIAAIIEQAGAAKVFSLDESYKRWQASLMLGRHEVLPAPKSLD